MSTDAEPNELSREEFERILTSGTQRFVAHGMSESLGVDVSDAISVDLVRGPEGVTLRATVDLPKNDAARERIYELTALSLAPFAAAVLVTRTAGDLEEGEAGALLNGLAALRSPLLREHAMRGEDPARKTAMLLRNPSLARTTLERVGAYLKGQPGGAAACVELVAYATRVAEASARRSGFLGLFGERRLSPRQEAALAALRALLA